MICNSGRSLVKREKRGTTWDRVVEAKKPLGLPCKKIKSEALKDREKSCHYADNAGDLQPSRCC